MGKIIKGGISYGGNGGSSDVSYNDLPDKPKINNVELSGNKTTQDLGITIPTKVSDLTNDSGFITSIDSEKPSFSVAQSRTNIASGDTVSTILGKIAKFFTDLANVAFSGSYNDLTDQPTIPTVNNATLTIQQNGTNVQTFTANQSTDVTANITVPTNTSDLNNDSGFITSSSLPTVNNSTITIQKNGTDVDSFTTNASSAKTINLTLSKSDVGLSNVENKSSATIRSELTASNVTTALGYTPAGWTVLSLTQTVSTSGNTTYTFSNANIKTTSTIDVYTDVFGYMPSAIITSNGSCTVTMPSYSSAASVTVKIYVINDT